ncbi:30S ribosomal protein S17 [Candidatus Gracilibacteria bacterium]|nr:30S ribosomal protein S17 [Candidatus Gracilibacteria bacterium]
MRTKKGVVTSTKMTDTIAVSVHSYKIHPKYKKKFRITKKFYAHDEGNTCVEGDTVEISESKPISKLKRWVLLKKLS